MSNRGVNHMFTEFAQTSCHVGWITCLAQESLIIGTTAYFFIEQTSLAADHVMTREYLSLDCFSK